MTIAAWALVLTEWRADLVRLYFDTLSESDPDLLREDEKPCFRPNEGVSEARQCSLLPSGQRTRRLKPPNVMEAANTDHRGLYLHHSRRCFVC